MFDTMRFTKVLGAACGSLLIFLLTSWFASALFYTGRGAETQAYTIDTGQGAAEAEVVAEGPAFEELLAAADTGEGEKVFAKCRSCHKMDGSNGTGPYLNGVVDREKAIIDGFAYSDAALAQAGQAWTPENLDGFLANPRGYMPGTKMSFAGLPKPAERANLIAWLAEQP